MKFFDRLIRNNLANGNSNKFK